MKKKAIKIAASTAVAASAFVAAAPAHNASAATNVEASVKAATNASLALRDVSLTDAPFHGDVTVQPWTQYNAAKAALKKAEADVATLPFSERLKYEYALDQVKLQITRSAHFIDAITIGNKTNEYLFDLQEAIAANNLDAVTAAYHKLGEEVRKQAAMLYKVYGNQTRADILAEYKAPKEALREEVKYDVTVHMLIEEAQTALAAGNETLAELSLEKAQTWLDDPEASFKWKSVLQANLDAVQGELTPTVTSVSAINASQIQVKFNQAVDAATVIGNAPGDNTLKNGVFNITRVPAGSSETPAAPNKDVVADSAIGSLSADGKTLTITAADPTFFDGEYAFTTVENSVKTINGDVVSTFSGVFTANDTVAPTVTGATYDVLSNKVTVTYSEPLASAPTTIRQNGTPVALDGTFVAGSKTVSFVNTATAGTTSSLYLAGAVDYKGHSQTLFNGSVYVSAASNAALTVTSLTQSDSNVVRVVFDKAVAGASAAAAAADIADSLTVLKDGAAFGGTYTVTRVASDTSNRTFDITFTGAAPTYGIYDGTATSEVLTFVLANDSITDIYGNKNGIYNNSVNLIKDVAGPAYVSTSVSTDKKTISVAFNEVLQAGSIDPTKFTVRRDGINVDPATLAFAIDSTGTKVEITKGDTTAFTAGTYTLRLEAGAVDDEHTNTNTLITANVAVASGSTAATPLTAAVANNATAGNTFEVTYSEEVTNSALSASNYTLDGVTLPAGSDIYFKDATKTVVVIVLPANTVNIGDASTVTTGTNAILGVKNVVDTDGDVVAASTYTVKVQDNTSSTLTAAQIVGDTLVFTFNENLDASSATADFDDLVAEFNITNGVNTLSAGGATAETLVSSVSGNKLTVTITDAGDSNWNTVKAAGTVTVTTLAGIDLQDSNNVDVKAGTTVTATR